ncbi:MAG: metal ABC transporter permease [Proteobacteria bacterium]|nr:metal ABC transporter permease [Pseudomonadota bacterium]MBU1610515.1 metal ABC transporter permease [Pseudomonadota bacterium]
MTDILGYAFMQNALMAGLLVSVACGVIGSLVVVNRMVFLAGGIAHAAYGGVGLAFFMGWPVLPSALGFSTFASLLMGAATLKRTERTDTIIGVMWAAGMATGILLLDLTPGYNVDLMSFLFGSILTVPHSSLWVMLGLDLVILLFVLFYYKDLMVMSFDREFARTRGVPVTWLHFLMPTLIAAAVVMIVQVVGLILVVALLTIPPHLAERTTRSLGQMMGLASLWAMIFCTCGLWLSYAFDLTSGASIIAVAVCTFALFLGLGRLVRLARRSR